VATPNLLILATVTPKILASAQLSSGDNTIYTVGSSKAAKIATLTLCNTTGSAVTLSVSVVPAGGGVDGTHRAVSGYVLAGGDATVVAEVAGMWLGASDFVSVNVSTGAAVDVVMSGIEFA
jgi:myosin-crossreactive antigen